MMCNKYTKRLSALFSSCVLTVFLSGMPSAVQARPIPSYILVPLTLQVLGYALPRIEKKLTPQQRQKIEFLKQETFQQIESVLTRVQRSKIIQSLRTRQKINTIVQSLKLTPTQKARIQSIIQASRQKINAILSDDTSSVNRNQKIE